MNMTDVAARLRFFEHQGIEYFWDIEGILEEPQALACVIDSMVARYRDQQIDYVAAFDARGFLFAGAIAHALGAGLKQIRKHGKLPGPTVGVAYDLEYRSGDRLEMEDTTLLSGKRVLLVDDVLATGGTAAAGVELVKALGGIVAAFAAVIELPHLEGRSKLLDYCVSSELSIIENEPVANVEYCVDALVLKEGELVLVEREREPLGLAMPGGRIEAGESARTAATRELYEETGLSADTPEFHGVLVGSERDVRGPKVSLVFRATTPTGSLKSETGVSRIRRIAVAKEPIPQAEAFAFPDHRKLILPLVRKERRAA